MNFLRLLVLITILWSSAFAIIVVPQAGEDRNLYTELKGNTYSSFHFQIINDNGQDILVAIGLNDLLKEPDTQSAIGVGVIDCQGEYVDFPTSGAYFIPGLNTYWTLTPGSTTPVLFIPNGQTADISLGVLVKYIPSVQAAGKYTGLLEFNVVN